CTPNVRCNIHKLSQNYANDRTRNFFRAIIQHLQTLNLDAFALSTQPAAIDTAGKMPMDTRYTPHQSSVCILNST
ncbi:MAG: hypothetical protein AAB110_10335, partial [Candidatus Desantisbacteria bacterium]